MGIIRHGAKTIHAHIREIRKFRSPENDEDQWSHKPTNQMMTNDKTNDKEMEEHQNIVKFHQQLEKFHFTNRKRACQKCHQNIKTGTWKMNRNKIQPQKQCQNRQIT